MADREDFEQFVAARSAALLRTAYLLTGSSVDAEDLVQRALVKAVPAWPRVQDPEAYVRRILVRENISRWRGRRWREVTVDQVPEVPEVPTELGASTEDRIVLTQALARLAPRQRAVIVLRYFEDLTEAQTADLLGISVGTVKSQHRDAISRLRALVPDLAAADS